MKKFFLTLALLAIASIFCGTNRMVFAGSTSSSTANSGLPPFQSPSAGSGTSTANQSGTGQSTTVPGGGPQVKPRPIFQSTQAIKPRAAIKPRP